MKDTFIMRGDWEKQISLLSIEQRGQLLSDIYAYQNRGEEPSGDQAVQLAFYFMQPFFIKNEASYSAKVLANQQNGALGGRPRSPEANKQRRKNNPNNPLGFSKTQTNPSEPNVTLFDVDLDLGFDSDFDVGVNARPRRFTPPTLAEVSAYVLERHSPVVPQEFIDFYASKGWVVGKIPMKDWKAACRNAEKWERWERAAQAPGAKPSEGEVSWMKQYVDRRKKSDGD